MISLKAVIFALSSWNKMNPHPLAGSSRILESGWNHPKECGCFGNKIGNMESSYKFGGIYREV